MRPLILPLLLISLLAPAQTSQKQHSKTKVPDAPPAISQDAEAVRFVLWEKQEDLRKRTGPPEQYFVPPIQKLISPAELAYYRDTYKKVDDVFYRDTTGGRVRILVAYGNDDSRSRLDPEVRVEKIHFIFDKDLALRDALAAIDELSDLCEGGCIMNGFSSTVIAQPGSPTRQQTALARKMKPHWRGQDMSDATPGAEIYYQESPYGVDFEHSPVDRIDLTLISNAGKERYSLSVTHTNPTVLDVWDPHKRRKALDVAQQGWH